MKIKILSFDYERRLSKFNNFVFGMDEVGRGSFAGPLVACAVYFKKEHRFFKDINDSKLLTHKKRVRLARIIKKNSVHFIESIEIDQINKLGIEKSNKLIFKNLIKKIKKLYKNKNIYFLVDGRKMKIRNKQVEFIVDGDQKHVSIAAASIVAKVERDRLMKNLGKLYPGYNFSKNKGYGTQFHRNALKKHGLSEVHRASFNLKRYV